MSNTIQNNNKINILVFSYVTSILLIYPIIRRLVEYYNLSFYFSFSFSLLSVFFFNYILYLIDYKYNFAYKCINSTVFQYYLCFFLNIENFFRTKKNSFSFFFGLIISIILCISYLIVFDEIVLFKIAFKKTFFYTLYYTLIIYIKIRSTIINSEVLEISLLKDKIESPVEHTSHKNKTTEMINYLTWNDFLQFYGLQNKCHFCFKFFGNKNQTFENIIPFSLTGFINPFFSGKTLSQKESKLIQNFKKHSYQIIYNVLGFFSGVLIFTICYKFVLSIDGIDGLRTKIISHIDSIILTTSQSINNHKKAFTKDNLSFKNSKDMFENLVIEGKIEYNTLILKDLHNKLGCLENLKQRINNLSFFYFLTKKNKNTIEKLNNVFSKYTGNSSDLFKNIQEILKNDNILSNIYEQIIN